MKSCPNVKLGQVGICSNIAQNHSFSPLDVIWSLLAPIHMQSWPNMKLGRYYLLQFGFIYRYLASKYHFCPYVSLFIYIYHYLPIFGLM